MLLTDRKLYFKIKVIVKKYFTSWSCLKMSIKQVFERKNEKRVK